MSCSSNITVFNAYSYYSTIATLLKSKYVPINLLRVGYFHFCFLLRVPCYILLVGLDMSIVWLNHHQSILLRLMSKRFNS